MNEYEKQGMKQRYPDLYMNLLTLDVIGKAVNKIWNQKYEEALAELATIDAIPLKK
jgi:hypothetical protein